MRVLVLPVVVAVLLAATLGRAGASEAYSPGAVGHDISWPQCGAPLPAQHGAFTVIGVTGGRALTNNPCFGEQVEWARAGESPISLYVNTKFPSGATVGEGLTGPAGNCAGDDWACQATNYGYKTARHAIESAGAHGVSPVMWWLDVETMSTWSETTALNALVLRAAVEHFQASGLPVGVYSTAHQWRVIAGDYAPGLPVWVGGSAASTADASRCRTGAFGGGRVLMIQYIVGGFDRNYVCQAHDYLAPAPATTPAALPASVMAPAPSATPAGTLSVRIPPRGFGLSVFSGGSGEQLVAASGCGRERAAFFFTFEGAFVVYVPGAQVTAVNDEFRSRFPGEAIPAGTPLVGKCG